MPGSVLETHKAYYDFWFGCNALYEKWAKAQGITVNMLFVLYVIDENEQDYNQRLICEKLMLPKQTVSTILDTLAKKGLVVKITDAADKRNKRIRFTEAGRGYAGELLERLTQFEEKALKSLDRKQREDFIRTSKVLLEALETLVDPEDF